MFYSTKMNQLNMKNVNYYYYSNHFLGTLYECMENIDIEAILISSMSFEENNHICFEKI